MLENSLATDSDHAAQALEKLVAAAHRAGEIALGDFRPGERTTARVDYNEGNSPVTSADLAVDAFLRDRCAADFPGAGWLSEETADDSVRLAVSQIVIADPIDGTRAFLAGDPRWCVALAFVIGGRPVAGVVHAPALATTYAASLGRGTTRNGVRVAASGRTVLDGARIGGPRPLVQSVAQAAGVHFEIEPRIPSLALRLACVADGTLDVALASTDSHDWDVAAADILLSEAGAALWQKPSGVLGYNKASTRLEALAAAPCALLAPLTKALAAAAS